MSRLHSRSRRPGGTLDVGYIAHARTQLQSTADSGSLAGPAQLYTDDAWTATDNPAALAAGTPVRTRVVVNFNRQSWLPTQFFVGSNAQVQGLAVMRKE